jgi:hypothetical protein
LRASQLKALLPLFFYLYPFVGVADERFLYLPSSDSEVKIQQGPLYTNGEPHLGGGLALDFIKGETDLSRTWQSFDVVAAADGVAIQSYEKGYGNIVLIRHEGKLDSFGRVYFSLYAHLDPETIDLELPHRSRHDTNYSLWKPVSTGDFLAKAGQTGKVQCVSSNCIHLHYEVFRGGYFQNAIDPYDVSMYDPPSIISRFNRDSYPPITLPGCGPSPSWIMCPPSPVPLSFGVLITRLNGQAVYDSDRNITWLANANLAASNKYGVPGIDPNGNMTWAEAQSWIAAMNAANYLGYSDWRLPTSDNCQGYNCTESELGHLFYSELGGTAGSPLSASDDPDVALFSNILFETYWTNTDYAPDPSNAWHFTGDGFQNFDDKASGHFAWPVRDGDSIPAFVAPRLDGQAVYDSARNITWLANANLAASNTFDVAGINPDGLMNWATAQNWIAAMNAANYLGYSDWRLPVSDTCEGFNCTDSEMGHLFYDVLGGVAGSSLIAAHNENYDLFQNIHTLSNWAGTEYALDPSNAWTFVFEYGGQGWGSKDVLHVVWPVRSGDSVPAVAIFCGNNICEIQSGETPFNCTADCSISFGQ